MPKRSVQWAQKVFVYEASGRSVHEVLRDFGAAQKVPVVVAEGVEGSVRGRFDSSPDEFLDALGKSFGLIWYHDGSTLYVYPSRAMQSRLFRLQGFDRKRVESLQAQLRWGDGRFPLKYSAREQTLLVTGPPRHLELVAQLIDVLDSDAGERLRQVVEVVPLRYAFASDRSVNGATITGLATTMEQLFNSDTLGRPSGPSRSGQDKVLEAAEASLPGTGKAPRMLDLLAGRTSKPAGGGTLEAVPGGARGLNSPLSDPDRPRFIADLASNSVIIVGSPLRMVHYVETLRKLDVEPLLIELEALILDVSTEQSESLGLSWSVSTGSARPIGDARWSASVDSPPLNIQTYWANAGHAIRASLTAMTQDGRAKLVSRPKVMATVNLPAVLSSQRRASVKVAGNLEAKLYSIDSGTSIQVTPQATLMDGYYRIRLSMAIEDGDFESRSVDGVPLMRRMQVTTDVRLTEGESVVLGGISADGIQASKSGIPFLADLPFIGSLFRTTDTVKTRTERLFMITPRVVHPTRPGEAIPSGLRAEGKEQP